MTTGIATRVKSNLENATGIAHLYRLSPPLIQLRVHENVIEAYEFVVVSAADVPFSGPETYIFGADESGKVLHWGELDGSFRGDLDHAEALERVGYVAVDREIEA